MLRSLLFFILICNFTVVVAQYEPQFSQNSFNLLSVNPGFAGSSGKVNLTGLWRNQWMGIEGAPKTTVFSADMGVKFLGNEHGIGFNALRDEIGAFVNLRLSLAYSFRIDIGEGSLGSGISMGVINQVLAGGDLYTDPKMSDESNIAIGESGYHIEDGLLQSISGELNANTFDLGMGVFYKDKRMYSGISVMHLHQPSLNLNENLDIQLQRTWFITGGYSFSLIDKPIDIEPQFFLKTDESIYQLDISTICKYKKRYWGGLSYRLQDAIVLLAGFEMKNGIKVGYSYDFTTSHLAGFQTHEVMFSYSFTVGVSKKSKHYRSVRYL